MVMPHFFLWCFQNYRKDLAGRVATWPVFAQAAWRSRQSTIARWLRRRFNSGAPGSACGRIELANAVSLEKCALHRWTHDSYRKREDQIGEIFLE
jgi:hypothetical protein